MGNILTNLFTGGASKLVETIGNTVDKFVTTKAESDALKIELEKVTTSHIEKMLEGANKEFELQVKDKENSINRDIQANNSANASWLAKNINPILALGCLVSTFAVYGYCFIATIEPENKDIVMIVIGSLNTIQAGVISYYFGASKQRTGK